MRCPSCGGIDDKVVDSRQSDDGGSIRRRRQCLECGRRYTTFERLEELPLTIVKRSGERAPFDAAKIIGGVQSAGKYRPITEAQLQQLATEVEESLRLIGPEVSSEEVGLAVLEQLRELDQVAYLRFASVYKGFDDPADFEREVAVLTKSTEPKRR
ncbi:MAG: transcriptional repressor NrdR [Acidimicrobiia bacterium]|nr:transcriptional repressor NrdR [Acidimicrobiia bacterium]